MFVLLLLPFTFFISPVFDAWEFDSAITKEAVYPGMEEPAADSMQEPGINPLIILNILGAAWFCGFLFKLFHLFFQISFIKGFKTGLLKIEDKRLDQIMTPLRKFYRKDLPAIYTSPALSSPVALGIIKPVIVIPAGLYKVISDDELRSIINHEMSHILHKDQLSGLLQRVVLAIYWWNPLVYIISAEFSKAREFISDNDAMKEINPRTYAGCLFTLAEKTNLLNRMPGIIGMATHHVTLKERIKNIIKKERKMQTKLKTSAAILVFLAAVFFIGMVSGYKIILAAGTPGVKAEAVSDAKKPVVKVLAPLKLLKEVKPVYPQEALDKKLQGEVLIEVNTDIYGRAMKSKLVKGKHKILNDAALKAVKQWVYEPGILNGVPQEAKFEVTIEFKLPKKAK
jgi:TonB family protein